MKTFAANCPSCGGPVEFRSSDSLVTVCEFCRTAVARTNKQISEVGRVADLLATRSGLQLGLTGKFKGRKFEIVGRVQYRHPAGGVWDEWYLAFSDRVGWLAEAQGRFYLLFSRPAKILGRDVDFDSLQMGAEFDLGRQLGTATVTEKGVATAASAEGEIPWRFEPGAPHRFADITGARGLFGTIEFDAGRRATGRPLELDSGGNVATVSSSAATGVSLGRETTPSELEITLPNAEEIAVPRTTTTRVNCPQCGGPLTLVAPDVTERVACPSCKALLDCDHGALKYLLTLKGKHVRPMIPLGSTGTFGELSWTIIGFMERYVVHEGTKYRWTEYLLYNRDRGFRWLVNSEGHWSFVTPLSPGEAKSRGMTADYGHEEFALFQKGTAYVSYVVGEFYWKVEIGEKVETSDYVRPPLMLSFERSSTGSSEELNVSLGRYVRHEELEQAFRIKELPRPWSIAPNQPPPEIGRMLLHWLWFGATLAGIYGVALTGLFRSPPDGWLLLYAFLGVSLIPIGALLHRSSFEVQRWSNSDYSPYPAHQ
ncbi:MAG: DUF4178 domain-containing protein [Planctomyces sp.]|nr:DUF4178 domain-containing protein [Planctomyces sp.]